MINKRTFIFNSGLTNHVLDQFTFLGAELVEMNSQELWNADKLVIAINTHCGSIPEPLREFLKMEWHGHKNVQVYLIVIDTTNCLCCHGPENVVKTWCFTNSLNLASQLHLKTNDDNIDLSLVSNFANHIHRK